jgi:hypothetical protein
VKERKPTQRVLRTRAILRSDKTLLTILARVIAWAGNTVAIIWLVLFTIVISTKAADGQVLVAVVAIPVLLFWLVARSLPRLVAWMTRDYP